MEKDLEQKLIESVKKDISNNADSEYKVAGSIHKQQFNEDNRIATVFVAFKKDPLNFSEQPLEKYFRYRLRNDGYNYSWHYVDSDG